LDIPLRDLLLARERITSVVRHTPLLHAETLSERAGAEVRLKLETLQVAGAFKARGAANKLLGLERDALKRGVVAVSTGNHGRAVAHVARALGVGATICVSERVPRNKLDAIKRLGAQVEVVGKSQDEAEVHAQALTEKGLTMVHPFDDPAVIAGQGTIGLELLEEFPQIKTVFVPLSGGGLIGGVALALKAADPAIRVVGVSMTGAPAMVESLRAGRPVELDEVPTLADSLQGGIGLQNRHTFHLVRDLVDETVLVTEGEIADVKSNLPKEIDAFLTHAAAGVRGAK